MLQRDTWWDIASFILRSVLTSIAAIILVLQANGYVIDFDRLRIEKAGLLVITTQTPAVTTLLDGKELRLQLGQLTKQYFPGQYQLEVRKAGYQTWQYQADIKKGHVAVFADITLFPEQLTVINDHPVTATELKAPVVSDQLRLVGTELWHRTKDVERLVTRLSVPMIAAVIFDSTHVIYETASEIHVIDMDGSNDQRLLEREFVTPMPLLIIESGRTLSVIGTETTTNYRLQ